MIRVYIIYDVNDVLCRDLNFTWQNKFTILGFEIDSQLEDMESDCDSKSSIELSPVAGVPASLLLNPYYLATSPIFAQY